MNYFVFFPFQGVGRDPFQGAQHLKEENTAVQSSDRHRLSQVVMWRG